ncbi:DUF6584 family protein [Motilibacter rhizosphaerae]|uniref:DUF6584 family protein n=1 Tax=Motilibacter rhizosphaerae TaxID=598652 RepID=UPI00102B0B6E|nr:DUF6584 family protein [Motilibacter rhizosphaerae]
MVVEAALADVAAGRPWAARDRLRSALVRDRTNPRLHDLLGEVLFAMGDLPAAGLAWFLSSRENADPSAVVAFEAMRGYYRKPQHLARSLRLRVDPSSYSAAARRRIEALQEELSTHGWVWLPPAPPRHVRDLRPTWSPEDGVEPVLANVLGLQWRARARRTTTALESALEDARERVSQFSDDELAALQPVTWAYPAPPHWTMQVKVRPWGARRDACSVLLRAEGWRGVAVLRSGGVLTVPFGRPPNS